MSIRASVLKAWQFPTFTWRLPHYHRRKAVSLPSSRWNRVVPTRYGHQAKLVVITQLITDRIQLHVKHAHSPLVTVRVFLGSIRSAII